MKTLRSGTIRLLMMVIWGSNYMFGVKKIEADGRTKYILALAFRGTQMEDSTRDLLVDLAFIGLNEYHVGFYSAANNAYNDLNNDKLKLKSLDGMTVREFINRTNIDDDYQVLVTGHSLGGAVASILTAEYLNAGDNFKRNIVAYTFGAPKSASAS